MIKRKKYEQKIEKWQKMKIFFVTLHRTWLISHIFVRKLRICSISRFQSLSKDSSKTCMAKRDFIPMPGFIGAVKIGGKVKET